MQQLPPAAPTTTLSRQRNQQSTAPPLQTTNYHQAKPAPGLYYRVCNRLLEGIAEHQDLHLIIDGQDTGTSDTTKNVGTCTLEERLDTLLGDDLATGTDGG